MKRWLVTLFFVWSAAAQPAAPLQPGQAVISCFSDNNASAPVIAVVDIRDPALNGAVVNQDWVAPKAHPAAWERDNIGSEIFGVALDDAAAPNIYLASTAIYKTTWWPSPQQALPGKGQVYKVQGTNWNVVTPLNGVPLPNTGQGLGDLAYDPVHDQLLVTNFHDGLIYRIDANSGAQLGTPYDPFPSTTLPKTPEGFAARGERPWGIDVFRGRAYFGNWVRDLTPNGTATNTILSVAIDPTTGALTGPAQVEVAAVAGQMPVSDIAFSESGRMLVAQRGMRSDRVPEMDTYPHQSRVLEYVLTGTTWVQQNLTKFRVGLPNNGTNSAGGVDYSCPLVNNQPAWAVMTGDQLQVSPKLIYGIQITPGTGGSPANSYLVDADEEVDPGEYDKTHIGDVEVYNTCERRCAETSTARVLCATDGSGDYFVTLNVKNLTPDTIHHLFLTGLPANVTASPSYFNLSSNPIPPNGTASIGPIRISGAGAGPLSFTMSIHNRDLEQCCALRVTVELPDCDCAQITSSAGPFCPFFPGTGYPYFFNLQNLFPGPVSFVLLTPEAPSNATFLPNVIQLQPAIGQNQSASLVTSITNVQPGERVCFHVSTHNDNLERCCAIRQCITIPRCPDFPFGVDGTEVIFAGRKVTIRNPNGDPTVRFPLPADTERVDLAWDAIPGTFPPGSFLEQRLRGSVDGTANQVIASARTVRAGNNVELRTSFPSIGATRYRYEFLRAGELVGFEFNVPADAPAILANTGELPTRDLHFTFRGPLIGTEEFFGPDCRHETPRCSQTGYTFDNGVKQWTIPGIANTYLADEVRVTPEDGRTVRIRASALEFQARGPTSVTFNDVRISSDCNDNGIDDADDIAGGTSRDLNRNGIPDECEGSAAGAISLNTGFDEGTRTPLPGGADDDDWRLVSPAPERAAKVIATPFSSWPAPLPESRWISAEGSAGTSLPGVARQTFERCFCLGADANAVSLDLALRADDSAVVSLNGQQLATGAQFFAATPLSVQRTGAVGDGLFVAGTNCLRVEVIDSGAVVTGFTLAGSVTANGAECTPR